MKVTARKHLLLLRLLLLVLPSLTPAAFSADPSWLQTVPPPHPGKFPTPASVTLNYSAGWAGMTAGKITATFSNTSHEEILHVAGGTSGLARVLYKLDTDSTSRCDADSLTPLQAEINEIYAGESRHSTLTFTPQKVILVRTTTPPGKNDGKEKVTRLPHVLDLQSSLLYLRSQPLKVGDKISFLTYATGSPYLARVTVVDRENLQVPCGKFPALKLNLDLQRIDKNRTLKPYTRAKNITAWLSDDPQRIFLKFTADLLIGTVFVEAEEISEVRDQEKS